MRFGRAWHAHVAIAGVAVVAGVAGTRAAPTPAPTATPLRPAAPAPAPAPAPPALAPQAVPDWQAGPAKVAVTPFENHVANGKNLEWIVAEAPFEIAEKTEQVLGLDALGAPFYVGSEPVPAEPDTVAAYAKKVGATWVITGWFDRVGADLRLDAIAWKVTNGVAARAGEAQRAGDGTKLYHRLLGDVIAEMWTKAGVAVDAPRAERLARALAKDTYAVALMGRGLGLFAGVLHAAPVGQGSAAATAAALTSDLKAAEKDLEKAVFVDPKLYEAQRLLGELYLATAPGDARAAARAAGKFNYASDLAPDDVASLRAAAYAAVGGHKHELALAQFKKLVARRPWDLDARYQLGAALWQVGDAAAAQHQLEQVTRLAPDLLAARRVLVLIHSAHGDTAGLVRELEEIAARAPADLDVRADLATAYGALGKWQRAIDVLAKLSDARPSDMALAVRLGDGHRKLGNLDKAIAWYAHAAQLAPDSSLPGFAIAQALYDAGRLADAARQYTFLQKYAADQPAAEQALGAIALVQHRNDDAAWYLRRAARSAPRSLPTRRAVIAAEVARKDAPAALAQLDFALAAWPNDAELHYLAGLAHQLAGDGGAARDELVTALRLAPRLTAAVDALAAVDGGGVATLAWQPELVRPWGDGDALQRALDRYAAVTGAMAIVRSAYQAHLLALLGALGAGPAARVKPGARKTCPVGELARPWAAAQQALAGYERLGLELEGAYRFAMRHDDAGMSAGLLPNGRLAIAAARRGFRLALADAAELRAEWARGLGPELRAAGCTDRLLAAAVADPAHYKIIEEDKPDTLPAQQPPRPRPRATFYVDNTHCADPVEVWIDGAPLGQVAPGRRSALVADGGERTLCLITRQQKAQCGDRETVRQVYLHDGWSVTMHCPK